MKVMKGMGARDWAVGAWAATLCIGVLVLLTWPISPWAKWDWAGQTAAAWVQAAGSIAAILGTAGVMVWQHRLQVHTERQAKTENELELIDGLTKLFALAAFQADTLLAFTDRPFGWEEYENEIFAFEDYASPLEALQLVKTDEIRSPNLILAFLAGRKAYNEFCTRIASIRQSPEPEQTLVDYRPRLARLHAKLEGSRMQFFDRRIALTASKS